MNSTIEYIRQLNQSSVHLQAEWLDRLKQIDVGDDNQLATPEIVLMDQSSIKNFEPGDYEPPITVVKKATSQSFESQSVDRTKPTVQKGTIERSDMLEKDPTLVVGSNASIEAIEFLACGTIETNTVGSLDSLDSLRSSANVVEQPVTELPESNNMVGQQVEHGSTSLETPAILNGIVRPTIMPLRQGNGTDVLSPGSTQIRSLQPTNAPASEAKTVEARHTDSTVNTGDVSFRTNETTGAIEMLRDFGLSPSQIESGDTMTAEQLQRLNRERSDSRAETQPVSVSPIQPQQVTSDQPAVKETAAKVTANGKSTLRESGSTSDPGLAIDRFCCFPSDKRAERFTYARTKRQKLVDTIVDQILQRYPENSCPTIMLVGASRAIDVDSAASRIATCMAGRSVGDVLLADGNLASRQLTSLLALSKEAGVGEILAGNSSANDLLVSTDCERLKVLGAGQEITNFEPEATASIEMLQTFKQTFSYSIISGGVAGEQLTDAMCSMVDGVYLIVDMDESDRKATVESVDYFRSLGTRIVGCIATRS